MKAAAEGEPSEAGSRPASTDLETTLRTVVATHIDVHPDRLRPEATLGADLEVDSLTAIELTMELEDAFDLSLPEEVVADVRTYGDLVAVVREGLVGRAPPPAGADPSP